MNLAEVQALFYEAVRADAPPPGLERAFVGTRTMPQRRRLEIYHVAYFARQEGVLAEIFARVRGLSGEATFRRWVKAYLLASPSERPAIEWVGERFPAFLRSAEPSVDAALVDLAELEWARTAALLAPEPRALATLDDLRRPDLGVQAVRAAPGLRLLELLPAGLAAFRGDGAGASGEPHPGRVPCVVYRARFRAAHRVVGESEARALRCLLRGASFAELCSAFTGPSAAEDAARTLRGWLDDGLIETSPR